MECIRGKMMEEYRMSPNIDRTIANLEEPLNQIL
jgi:hypothetical protein